MEVITETEMEVKLPVEDAIEAGGVWKVVSKIMDKAQPRGSMTTDFDGRIEGEHIHLEAEFRGEGQHYMKSHYDAHSDASMLIKRLMPGEFEVEFETTIERVQEEGE